MQAQKRTQLLRVGCARRTEAMKVGKSQIGFVGLGGMGGRMAHRLIDAGFQLTVYDRAAHRLDSLVVAGARAAHGLSMISANSDVIMSCVTNDEGVLDIYAGT